MMVTKLSSFDDMIWDYSNEYLALKGKCNKVLKWDNFWAQQPLLCATAKAFALSKKSGTATTRPCEWGTVRVSVMRIAVWAHILVENGMTRFDQVNSENLHRLIGYLPQSRYGQKILGQVALMYRTPGLPHIPSQDPFLGQPAQTIIRQSKVKRKTPAIPDHLITKMVHRALEYEQRLPQLLRLQRSPDWDSAFAVSRNITNIQSLQRELNDTQMAGIVLILASTGMRCSELLALHADSLRCEQKPMLRWLLKGTVFKFHGIGVEAQWSCTSLGRRGFKMIRRLSPKSTPLVVTLRSGEQPPGSRVSTRLTEWMGRQEWRNSDGKPYKITAHQFRPTFAQWVTRAPGMNELALMDHFHHHDLLMTDGYVGSEEGYIDSVLKPYPKVQKANWERERLKQTGALSLL